VLLVNALLILEINQSYWDGYIFYFFPYKMKQLFHKVKV
jgi:hypothetical protein